MAIFLVDFFGWIFWLIFWIVENTLPILLKHSKLCSFIKTISLKQKQHVLRTFQFWPKSLYPDLTGVAIFFVDFLKCWKYPSNSSRNIQNCVLSSKLSVWRKKTAGFADFSILTQIAVSGPYRRGHFFGWFFWLIFWNVENTLPILLKHSKLCSFIKTISLKQKQQVLRTFQFWTKSLYPDLTGMAIFLVGWFFEMLKIPFQFFWNIQNCVLSSKQSVWSKNSMFCGLFNFVQNRCIQTLPAWPFFWLIFFVDFLKCWKYPSNSSDTFKIVFYPSKQSVWSKNSMFCGLFNFDQNRCIRTSPAWPFFWLIFEMLKIPFQFFWNIQNCVLPSKQSVWSKNSRFCGLFNFEQNRCIRTLPAWPFFWLIFFWFFGNVENTLPILLIHSKLCSFIKTISLKQRQHVLRTFQLWPKSLYPDLTGVAIFLVDFFGWFFEMLKIPLQFFCIHSKLCSFIKTISLKQNQQVLRTFQFWTKSLYPDLTGVAIFLVDFFGWLFEMLEIPFQFFWNIQNCVLSSKQ